MESEETPEQPGVAFAGEYLQRYESNLRPLNVIKEWRTREFDAGRPSSLEDYCRAHALCPHCYGVGLARNENDVGFKAVGWDGDTQLFERCKNCDATGQLSRVAHI